MTNKKLETIYFGAGCFWHVQQTFDNTIGVIKTEVGYMGGQVERYPNPTYEEVCSGKTNYAGTVKVVYDSNLIAFSDLLEVFWDEHNPTSKNRQGADIGSQYRSIIFYTTEKQKNIIHESLKEKQKEHTKPIVTEIQSTKNNSFFPAEEYHQKYLERK